MKFENVKVGQILEDIYGNRYKVLSTSTGNPAYPVFLECIKFKKAILVDSSTTVTDTEQTFWIVRDSSILLSIDEGPGKFIKENFYSSLALSNSLEYITLQVEGGRKRDYILGRGQTINKIGLTLSELEVAVEDYLTPNNITNRMKVIDGLGNQYTVFDYGTEAVRLSRSYSITATNGATRDVDVVLRIPYYKAGITENMCTTKDFKIVKD